MTSAASTPEQYQDELTADRKPVIQQLRTVIKQNLPPGFEETMAYGMITYVVPHRIFPAGYHCDPKQALPFISLASQKNFIALYHMGLYASPALMEWFLDAWPKHSAKKLDMGKSCIRFKKPEDIPFGLIGELCARVSVEQWIENYQAAFTQKRKA